MRIGAVDLFCGIGGLTCGLQQAGIEVIAGIDLDASCKYAYTENNGSLFINKSVSEITGKEIKNLLTPYDIKILVGCAPCQPFSNHQKDKKNRKKHKEWHLLGEYARIVRETRPHVISMENVPELRKEAIFGDFLATLEKLHYHFTYQIVDASDYGVPQRRRRLVLLASRFGDITLIPPTNKYNKTHVYDAIYNMPNIRAGEQSIADPLHYSPHLSSLNTLRIKASTPGGSWHDWPENLMLACHKRESGHSYRAVYGRMRWDDVSPTITTEFINYGTGRFGHPEQDRAISLREGSILQSFPPHYKFIQNSTHFKAREIAKHIGNAVPPRLGEIIGESIISHLKQIEVKGRND